MGHCDPEESYGGVFAFVGASLDEVEPERVIDGYLREFPARAARLPVARWPGAGSAQAIRCRRAAIRRGLSAHGAR